MDDGFWVEEYTGKSSFGVKRKRRIGKRKIEFVGWASRPLYDFLVAIGQDTTKEHSRHDVAAFITKYINENNLASAQKKKKVLCDGRLYALFGKKSMPRIKIFELLEEHFAENHLESDSEFLDSSDEENCRESSLGFKNSSTIHMKKVQKTPRSGFAAIVPENIKLIYLRRSLVQEFLKDPQSFEFKILGSFVRMKSDPNDIYQKNRFMLQLVTGVERVPGTGDTGTEVCLRVANFFKELPICELSDDNFSEEEIEDLQDRVKAGSLKRLTINEVELKAQTLHAAITKDWIVREISLLQKLIDRANEKGWRRELFEHRERRKMLQTPAEQEKLLNKVPEVIAEELKPVVTVDDASGKAEEMNPSPTPILQGSSGAPNGDDSDLEEIPRKSQVNSAKVLEIQKADVNGFVHVPNSTGFQLSFETPKQKETGFLLSFETTKQVMGDGGSHLIQEQTRIPNHGSTTTQAQDKPQQAVHKKPDPIVINLSDDDDSEHDPKVGSAHSTTESPFSISLWHYRDPKGQTQGPFTLYALKRWRDANYFPPGFMVWRSGQTSQDGVLLADVLHQTFSC